jgi:hypothetical protein
MGEIPDEGNLKEVLKQDKIMKDIYQNELGEDFESFENGVAIGQIRHTPLAPMSPFQNNLWPETEDRMNIIGQNGNDGLHYDKGEEDV